VVLENCDDWGKKRGKGRKGISQDATEVRLLKLVLEKEQYLWSGSVNFITCMCNDTTSATFGDKIYLEERAEICRLAHFGDRK
jgi:hypothetical protein